jgi:hypothetical protein
MIASCLAISGAVWAVVVAGQARLAVVSCQGGMKEGRGGGNRMRVNAREGREGMGRLGES